MIHDIKMRSSFHLYISLLTWFCTRQATFL